MKHSLHYIVFALVAYLIGCQETHFPIDSLPQGSVNSRIGDTVYVLQNPVWTGFNHPQGIIVGNEPFIYVADTDNDRIVMLDLIGRVIGYSQKINHPVALTEDKRLQLIVCAQFDTLLPGKQAPTTFGAGTALTSVRRIMISARSSLDGYSSSRAIRLGATPVWHLCTTTSTTSAVTARRTI